MITYTKEEPTGTGSSHARMRYNAHKHDVHGDGAVYPAPETISVQHRKILPEFLEKSKEAVRNIAKELIDKEWKSRQDSNRGM